MFCSKNIVYPYAQYRYAPPDNGCTPDNYHCENDELVKNKDALLSLSSDYVKYDYQYCSKYAVCD